MDENEGKGLMGTDAHYYAVEPKTLEGLTPLDALQRGLSQSSLHTIGSLSDYADTFEHWMRYWFERCFFREHGLMMSALRRGLIQYSDEKSFSHENRITTRRIRAFECMMQPQYYTADKLEIRLFYSQGIVLDVWQADRVAKWMGKLRRHDGFYLVRYVE